MDTWNCNIAGSTDLPEGWTWGEHWGNSGAGQAGYFLHGPNGFRVRVQERGAWMPTAAKLIAEHEKDAAAALLKSTPKSVVFLDSARNGMAWQLTYFSHPIPRRDWMTSNHYGAHVQTVRELRAAGWDVEVWGDGPGSDELRAAAA